MRVLGQLTCGGVSPFNWLDQLTKSMGKCTKHAGTLAPLEEQPCQIRIIHSRKQHVDPALRSPRSTELLLAAKPRARRCQRAPSYHIGNAEYKKNFIERGGSFDQNKDRHFTLVSPSDRNPNKKHNAYNHFKTHQDAIYVADMEGAQKKNVKFYHTLSGLVVCVDTITKEYVRKHLPSEIVQEAKKDGRSVHFASLVGFCHLEHTELAKHLQTYKGTVVLWAERATPQTKGEQGASASHMAATGLLDDSLAWRAKPTTRYQPRRRCTCRKHPDCGVCQEKNAHTCGQDHHPVEAEPVGHDWRTKKETSKKYLSNKIEEKVPLWKYLWVHRI